MANKFFSARSGRRKSLSPVTDAIVETMERRFLLSSYTVNTLSDAADPGAGLLTLRRAVEDANAHSGADTIAFSPSVFTAGTQHTIKLTQGQITFTDTSGTTTVSGSSANVVSVSGNNSSRVFGIVPNAIVSISGLTITGGKQTTADSSANTYGGGIYNAGILTLTNSVITENQVVAASFQPINEVGNAPIAGTGYGGGIYSTGPMTIHGTTLVHDSVTNTAVIRPDGTIVSDTGAAYGGAIYTTGPLSLDRVDVLNNSAVGSFGDLGDSRGAAGQAFGGGIYVIGSLNVSSSTISGNVATGGDPDGLVGSAGGDAWGGGIYAGGVATISETTLNGNTSVGGSADAAPETSAGGGLFAASDAAITSSTIDGNSLQGGPGEGSAGGGIYGEGKLTIKSTSISGNSVASALATDVSGARDGGLSFGGGIAATAPSVVTGSTIANNSAIGGQGPNAYAFYTAGTAADGDGGGIYTSSSLTITNSTIANNTATGGVGGAGDDLHPAASGADGNGGGIFTTGDLTVWDSTISGNRSTAGAGGAAAGPGYDAIYPAGAPGNSKAGGVYIAGGDVPFANTIVSANTAAGAFNDIVGIAASSSANNLIGVGGGLTNGVKANKVGINDPKLAPLGNYGGPTLTMVPLPGSPAIDAGSNRVIPAGITTDQRGFARIIHSVVDIGADEYGTPVVTGTVFNDFSGDGVRQTNEPGVAGQMIYADLNNNGKLDPKEPSTVTDLNGDYSLTGLTSGAVVIRQILQPGQRQSFPLGTGQHLTVGPAAVSGVNFGATTKVFVSGNIFKDANGNGKKDAAETGLAGWTVYVDLNNDGKFERGENSKIADANGNFAFIGLSAGTYVIRVAPPAGWHQTFPIGNAGQHFTLASGASSQNLSFGFAPTVAAGLAANLGIEQAASVAVAANEGKSNIDFGERAV